MLIQLRQIATTELAPTGETLTRYTWNGAPVYALRYTGASLPTATSATLATGVTKILMLMGYCTGSAGQVTPPIGTVSQVVASLAAGNLTVTNVGTAYDGNPFDLSIWYTK